MAAEAAFRTFALRPLAGALGAEIAGVDLSRPLETEQHDELLRAFARYFVLLFRDQALSPERQIAATRLFGPPLTLPFIAPHPDHPEIIRVLKEADEERIATFGGTWHSDFSFLPEPPLGSLLYALEVPAYGGDTLWSNMAAVFDSLSPGLQRCLQGLSAVHSGATIHGTRTAGLAGLRLSRSVRMDRGNPAADFETEHPVVCRHPASGRQALFVNPVYTQRFAGMTEAESRPLLDYLQSQVERPEFTCRIRWTAGSLAVWDNRVTQHLAVNDYDGTRRLLHRTAVAGAKPRSAPGAGTAA